MSEPKIFILFLVVLAVILGFLRWANVEDQKDRIVKVCPPLLALAKDRADTLTIYLAEPICQPSH